MPKARLMQWDGDVMRYQSIKKQMMELLDYDNKSLELEMLKQQIRGPKANEALKCLYNVHNKKHVFEILDAKYGDILMVFPRIKADLETLKDLPTNMQEEPSNIQEIINVAQTYSRYGKKEAIDSAFIQRFCNKLSKENRKLNTMRKINTNDTFVTALYEFLQINDELKITSNENKSNFDNLKKNKRQPCCLQRWPSNI